MPIQFNQCEVSINGQKIMAESASISEQNSINPDVIIGNYIPIDYSPTDGIKNSFDINYNVETNNEPNYIISTGLKTYSTGYSPAIIIIGGITGSGYLQSYTLQVSPNNNIKGSVNFISFHELQGNLIAQPSSNLSQYNVLNRSGLGHYWTTQAINQDNSATGSIIQMDYSFKANWNPVYPIGQSIPSQVLLLNAQETFNFVSEFSTHIKYTGENANTALNNFNSFKINNLSFLWDNSQIYSLNFPISGGIINSNKIDIKTDSLITISNSITKFY
jgi:hypothetical protein